MYELIDKNHAQIEWLVKANEMFNMILKHIEKYPEEFHEEIYTTKICLCYEMNEIRPEDIINDGYIGLLLFGQDGNLKNPFQALFELLENLKMKDVYYYLRRTDTIFGKRANFCKYYNGILPFLKPNDKKKYIVYKNSLFVCDFFKCNIDSFLEN